MEVDHHCIYYPLTDSQVPVAMAACDWESSDRSHVAPNKQIFIWSRQTLIEMSNIKINIHTKNYTLFAL